MLDELERLAKLWQIGALTDEEFAAGKQRLFASLSDADVEPPAPEDSAPVPLASPETEIAPSDAIEPMPGDELLFDDLNAMLADMPLLDAVEVVEAEAIAPDTITEVSADDDPLFDDLNAMLEDGAVDLPSLEDIPITEEVPLAALSEATEPSPDDDLLFDDLNAMLGEGLANLPPLDEGATAEIDAPVPPPSSGDVPEAGANEEPLFDDLDVVLEQGLADLPPLNDVPVVEEAPVANALNEAAEPEADDDLLFDDLNVMLDEGLADLPPLHASATGEMGASVAAPSSGDAAAAVDEDPLFDDLNAMLDAGLADLKPLDEIPPAEAAILSSALPSGAAVEEVADDDLLFDDLNVMLEQGLADLPPVDDLPPSDAPLPQGKSALVAHAELLADDLDMTLEVVVADATPLEDLTPAADMATDNLEAAGIEPALEEPPSAKRARRNFAFGKVIAARLAKLPRPVLLGIGGGALFFGAMGIGIALAVATRVEPEAAAAKGHESAEHAATAHEEGGESAHEAPSPAEHEPEPQMASSSDDVLHQCPTINAMTEAFGTALAEHHKVPIRSLKVIAGSGHVRADAHASVPKACLVAFDMKTGPRQCRVDAVVRYPDGDVGAHLGEARQVVCEGDSGFEMAGGQGAKTAGAEHAG